MSIRSSTNIGLVGVATAIHDDREQSDSSDEYEERAKVYRTILDRIKKGSLDLGNNTVALEFVDEFGPYIGDYQGSTIIHQVLQDAHDTDSERYKPLFEVCLRACPDLLEYKNEMGETALHLAIRKRLCGMIRAVCDSVGRNMAQAAIACFGIDRGNCVHAAIRRDLHIDATEYLIDISTKEILEMQDAHGNTPLHAAVEYKRFWKESQVRLVMQLLDANPKAMLMDNWEGLSPYRLHIKTIDHAMGHTELQGSEPDPSNSPTNTDQKSLERQRLEMSKDSSSKQPRRKAIERQPPVLMEHVEQVTEILKGYYLLNCNVKQIRHSLYGSGEKLDIDLDLSGATGLSRDVFANMSRFLRLDRTLRYVALSSRLMKPSEPSEPSSKFSRKQREITDGRGRSDLCEFFRWLKNEKSVKRILRLVVDDLEDPPHSDEAIESALREFDVEVLDWRRFDINSSTIRIAAPRVRVLHLYSSGNNAVLRDWAGKHGVGSIHTLEEIRLYYLQGLESSARTEYNIVIFFEKIRHRWPKIKYEYQPYQAGSAKMELASDVSRTNGWMHPLGQVAKFIVNVRLRDRDDVKVALIDDGVALSDNLVAKGIVEGISLVAKPDSDVACPWFLPSSNDGTAMARLILDVLPTAKLLVARIDRTVSAEQETRVAQAFDWALHLEADIICVAFQRPEESSTRIGPTKKLRDSVRRATDCGVVTICPGNGIVPVDGTITISAADKYGSSSTWTRPIQEQAQFLFPEKLKEADDKETPLNPISHATALATGLAALILQLLRLGPPEERIKLLSLRQISTKDNYRVVHQAFERLSVAGRFVKARALGDIVWGPGDGTIVGEVKLLDVVGRMAKLVGLESQDGDQSRDNERGIDGRSGRMRQEPVDIKQE